MERSYCLQITPYSLEEERIDRIIDADVRLVILDLSETEMVNVPLLERIVTCYDCIRRSGREFRIRVQDEDIVSVFKFLKLSRLLIGCRGAEHAAPHERLLPAGDEERQVSTSGEIV